MLDDATDPFVRLAQIEHTLEQQEQLQSELHKILLRISWHLEAQAQQIQALIYRLNELAQGDEDGN
jgi:hypothetical protein